MLILLLGAALALSFLAGRHRVSSKTVPWRIIFQLIEHRRGCLGEPPSEVVAGLAGKLGISKETWARCVWAWEGQGASAARLLHAQRDGSPNPDSPRGGRAAR